VGKPSAEQAGITPRKLQMPPAAASGGAPQQPAPQPQPQPAPQPQPQQPAPLQPADADWTTRAPLKLKKQLLSGQNALLNMLNGNDHIAKTEMASVIVAVADALAAAAAFDADAALESAAVRTHSVAGVRALASLLKQPLGSRLVSRGGTLLLLPDDQMHRAAAALVRVACERGVQATRLRSGTLQLRRSGDGGRTGTQKDTTVKLPPGASARVTALALSPAFVTAVLQAMGAPVYNAPSNLRDGLMKIMDAPPWPHAAAGVAPAVGAAVGAAAAPPLPPAHAAPPPPPALPVAVLSAAQTEAFRAAIEPDIASLRHLLRVSVAPDGRMSCLAGASTVDRGQLSATVIKMGCFRLLRRDARNEHVKPLVFAAARPGEEPRQRVHPAGVLREVYGINGAVPSALLALRSGKVAADAEPLASPGTLAASPMVALARELYLAVNCAVDARTRIVGVLAAAGGADTAMKLLDALSFGAATGAAANRLPPWLELVGALLHTRPPWAPEPCGVLRAYTELLMLDGLDAPGMRVAQLYDVAELLLRGGTPLQNTVTQLAAKSSRRWLANGAKGAALRGKAAGLLASMVWRPLMAGKQLPLFRESLVPLMAPGFMQYTLRADRANFSGMLEGLCFGLAPDGDAGGEPSGDPRLMGCVARAERIHVHSMFTTHTPQQWSTDSQALCSRQRGCAAGVLPLMRGLRAGVEVIEYFAVRGPSGTLLHGTTARAVVAEYDDDDGDGDNYGGDAGGGGGGGGSCATPEGILGGCIANDRCIVGWHPNAYPPGSVLPSCPFSSVLAQSALTGEPVELADMGRRPSTAFGVQLTAAIAAGAPIVTTESAALAVMLRQQLGAPGGFQAAKARSFAARAVCVETCCWRADDAAYALILLLCAGHSEHRALLSDLRTRAHNRAVHDALELAVRRAEEALAGDGNNTDGGAGGGGDAGGGDAGAGDAGGGDAGAGDAGAGDAGAGDAGAGGAGGGGAGAGGAGAGGAGAGGAGAGGAGGGGAGDDVAPSALAAPGAALALAQNQTVNLIIALKHGLAAAAPLAAAGDATAAAAAAALAAAAPPGGAAAAPPGAAAAAAAGAGAAVAPLFVAVVRRTSPSSAAAAAAAAASLAWQNDIAGQANEALVGVPAVPGAAAPSATAHAAAHRAPPVTVRVFDALLQPGTQPHATRVYTPHVPPGAAVAAPMNGAALEQLLVVRAAAGDTACMMVPHLSRLVRRLPLSLPCALPVCMRAALTLPTLRPTCAPAPADANNTQASPDLYLTLLTLNAGGVRLYSADVANAAQGGPAAAAAMHAIANRALNAAGGGLAVPPLVAAAAAAAVAPANGAAALLAPGMQHYALHDPNVRAHIFIHSLVSGVAPRAVIRLGYRAARAAGGHGW
jgi:hypothetical protein